MKKPSTRFLSLGSLRLKDQLADQRVIASAFLVTTGGRNDQTHRRCARALCCVLSSEHALRPASAARQFDNSCPPRMWFGTSTGRRHLRTELRSACRGPQVQRSKNAHGERSL